MIRTANLMMILKKQLNCVWVWVCVCEPGRWLNSGVASHRSRKHALMPLVTKQLKMSTSSAFSGTPFLWFPFLSPFTTRTHTRTRTRARTCTHTHTRALATSTCIYNCIMIDHVHRWQSASCARRPCRPHTERGVPWYVPVVCVPLCLSLLSVK